MANKILHIFLGVIVATILFWTALLLQRHFAMPALKQSRLRQLNPELADRVANNVSGLKQESVFESLKRMDQDRLFNWPGPFPRSVVVYHGLPVGSNSDMYTVETIASNRRFRKLYQELGEMSKSAAAKALGEELTNSLSSYPPLYSELEESVFQHFQVSQTKMPVMGWPMFTNDTASLLGTRLKILSLVWISGLLELDEVKPQINAVAEMALTQRDRIYAATRVDPIVREDLLRFASLYHREIVGYAVVFVRQRSPERAAALARSNLKIVKMDLVRFDSEVTEFDLPVASKMILPDYSKGFLVAKWLSVGDEKASDELWRTLKALP
jgi:hypothetical protein